MWLEIIGESDIEIITMIQKAVAISVTLCSLRHKLYLQLKT